jgi:hypothetical protein
MIIVGIPAKNLRIVKKSVVQRTYEKSEVRDEESTTAVFIAEVGKAPNISEANTTSSYCQNELALLVPFLSDV